MKRAVLVGVLVAFAAGCFLVANYDFSHQVATAETYLGGSAHYQPNCEWTYKQDGAILWNYEQTEVEGNSLIWAPPTYYYHMWGDWDGWYWLEGITYHYYDEYWKLLRLYENQSRTQDIWFCYDEQPDSGAGE
jgi:hypothetical protein